MTDAAVLDAFRRIVREELAAALDRTADPRLGAFCGAVERFLGHDVWSASELLSDARRCGFAPLVTILEGLVGDGGDPARRLGRWLSAMAGRTAGGYTLVRVKREAGRNLFVVQPME